MGNSIKKLKPFVNFSAIVTATQTRDKLVEFNVEDQISPNNGVHFWVHIHTAMITQQLNLRLDSEYFSRIVHTSQNSNKLLK